MTTLFDPIKLGALDLPNRIFMAPLTRSRATEQGRVPTDLMREYYMQRASAGLIVTEATSVDAMGVGYERTPGIWSDEQVEGWKRITTGVHSLGGHIVLQLWHVGRISDPSLLDGRAPLAPSPIAAPGNVSLLRPERPYAVPRALLTEEITGIVEQFRRGAQNAQRAGFDGVEIHGANGYLLDQFLQDISNQRDDQYGGPIENRARLHLEVTDAVTSVWGADRVGMHLAPRGDAHGMGDSQRAETFGYLAEQLGQRKLAFLFSREYFGDDSLGPLLKKKFGGAYVINEKVTIEASEAALEEGIADAVGFGVKFIANPDLPARLRQGAPLNPLNKEGLYFGGPVGYTDYPSLGTEKAA
jgi:2,4-dienoyl-CoA reductase-like NADH-dependent reductase (Old Yellow Enzyme family)